MMRVSQKRPRRKRAIRGALAVALSISAVLADGAVPQTTAGGEALALPDLEVRLQAARDAVRQHSDLLKSRLAETIKTAGLKGAVGSCKPLAPELNAAVGDAAGIEITRTALRLRNPDNAPDTWEMANLELFVKQLTAGADHKTIEAYDVLTTKEGQKLFRYMKPIMTGEMCLGCHGPAMSQDIKQEIARNYPEDKATGFNLGELRGAFSVVQEVE
jgi:hypothetical protein